jgi:hypothetical protein
MVSPPTLDSGRSLDTAAFPESQSGSPAELLTTWQAWNCRDRLAHDLAKARAAGDARRVATVLQALSTVAVVEPLDALAANHQLVGLLLGRQPQAIRTARHAGASWQQIAAAIGTTAEQACAAYLAHQQHTTPHPPNKPH